MTRRTITFWLPASLLAFSPAVAYANAGTPLLFAGAFHLLLGNALIGIVEGLALAIIFRPRQARSVPIMIAANYVSAWLGGVYLASTISHSLDLDLHNACQWLWCMVAITYFLTLLLEWPFVALCLRKTDGWLLKSLWGTLLVQSASYLVLFGWYWAASDTRLYTDVAVVQPSALAIPNGATLYYIADGGVDARELDQEDARRIDELQPSEHEHELLLQESRTAPGRWDLVLSRDLSPHDRVVCADLAGAVAEPPWGRVGPGGDVPRFRTDTSGWEFYFGWMAGGLYGNNKDGRALNVGLETPFLKWPVQYPTQLPNGQVVFQLGTNQICVIDPNVRKVALLAKGRCPVVIVTESRK